MAERPGDRIRDATRELEALAERVSELPPDCDPVGVHEAAQRLAVSVHTIRAWRKRGELPPPAGSSATRTFGTGPAWRRAIATGRLRGAR